MLMYKYLCLVSQNDKDTSRQRRHRYPHSILQYLEAIHIILYQKCYCTHIRMRLQSKSKVWLWTRRIVANGDILINFSNCLFYVRWRQVQTSRDDMQQSLSEIFHAVAVFHNSIPARAKFISFCVSEKRIWCYASTRMKTECLNSQHYAIAIKESRTTKGCHVNGLKLNHITMHYLWLVELSWAVS